MLLAGLLQRIVVPQSEIENYFVHMLLMAINTLLLCGARRTLSSDSARLLQPPTENTASAISEVSSREGLPTRVSAQGGTESARYVDSLLRLLNDDTSIGAPRSRYGHWQMKSGFPSID